MRGCWTQQRDLHAGIPVLLDALLDFVRRAAGGHSLHVGVRDRFDQSLHPAFRVGLFEERNIFLANVGLANAHFRRGNKGDLNRIEFCRYFPAHGVKRGLVVIFDRAVNDLGHFEVRKVSSRLLHGIFYNL